MGEFELIDRYFNRPPRFADAAGVSTSENHRSPRGRVALGIGDDCALIEPAPGMQLAVSNDLLVEGRHFLSTVDPARLGHKSLAVNLSDLAACGARPLAFTLALSMPNVDEGWLEGFSRGMFALADAHGCALAGGDTTRGPLTVGITVFGEVPRGGALLRSGAGAGDDLWVSGSLGQARLALEIFRGTVPPLPGEVFEHLRARMETPTPRLALGQALRGVATSAIDLSDGLVGDLAHVLRASRVGATLDTSTAIELIANEADITWALSAFDVKTRLQWVLAGGDDYELAFTAPAAARDAVEAAGRATATRVTRIGRIDAEAGLRLVDGDGHPVTDGFASFDHFS